MSHDYEVGTNVSCEESAVSLRTGLTFPISFSPRDVSGIASMGNHCARKWLQIYGSSDNLVRTYIYQTVSMALA